MEGSDHGTSHSRHNVSVFESGKTQIKLPGLTPFASVLRRRIYTDQVHSLHANKKRRMTKNEDQTLDELVNKTWNIFCCSPLHRFSNKSSDLKSYSRSLSAMLTAHTQIKTVVGVQDSEVGTKANFSCLDGIAVDVDDPPAIRLTVTTKEKKSVAEMILCSVDANDILDAACHLSEQDTSDKRADKPFTILPLLLWKGNITTRNVVFDWLKTEFDCNIQKMFFNPLSLGWMLSMWSSISSQDRGHKSTQIAWKIPVPDTGLNYIESTFNPESIAVLWQGCHKESSDTVTKEEMESFVNGLQEHLAKHFRIKFAALPLERVHMPIVHLHADGKVKLFSNVHAVLNHLTQLAVEKLHWGLESREERY